MLDEKTGNICEIKSRKNNLIRPRVCNVDQVIVVFAVQSPDINHDLLDRFIILAEEQQLEIIICFNKTDLCDYSSYEELQNIYSQIGYKVICLNVFESEGISVLRGYLKDKVSVLAGPSGVGKSSIANVIKPGLGLQTGELSLKIERGKHTTRHAELIEVYDNSYVVDSPGFTSVSLSHIDKKKLPYLFKEFTPFLGKCRFTDCSHVKETDCAIKDNVGISINSIRYERYVRFFNV